MTDSLIVELQNEGPRKPVFLVPAAASTPFSFASLAEGFKSQRPLFTFEFAGLLNTHPPHKTIGETAGRFVDEIRSVQQIGPYYLGGHCLGGVIALEMAALLERLDEEVRHLVLLESLPPPRYSTGDGTLDPAETTLISDVDEAEKEALTIMFRQMEHQLSKLPEDVRNLFQKFGWDQMRMSVEHLATPIVAPVCLIRTGAYQGDAFHHWERLTAADYREIVVAGTPDTMLIPPYARHVAGQIDHVCSDD